MSVDPDPATGQIVTDGIRYMMIRPDVLMGVACELRGVSIQTFLEALERSAFRHVQASFAQYQAKQPRTGLDFIERVCEGAAQLGWGTWSALPNRDGSVTVEVHSSPFAAGFGSSQQPVCAAITGILRAAAVEAQGGLSPVTELVCAAQGRESVCRFEIPPPGR
jgi:predicted hydrocarbon binding protein